MSDDFDAAAARHSEGLAVIEALRDPLARLRGLEGELVGIRLLPRADFASTLANWREGGVPPVGVGMGGRGLPAPQATAMVAAYGSDFIPEDGVGVFAAEAVRAVSTAAVATVRANGLRSA